MSNILILAGILIILGKASSYYNKSYDGYTFILPGNISDHSNSRPLELLSFSEAQQWCKINVPGSTLATIRNKDVQRDIANFLDGALHIQNYLIRRLYNNFGVRVNGKFHITDAWHWVNGHQNSGVTVHEQHNNSIYPFYAYMYTDPKNFSIYSDTPNSYGDSICEFPGKSKVCDLFFNGRCYQKTDTWFKWYDARNNCSDRGGDLASFETLSDINIYVLFKNLSLVSHWRYWIGLQKNEWRWEDAELKYEPTASANVVVGSAIKYTNWNYNHPSNYSARCLCLIRSQWNECDCDESYPFICMLNDMSDAPTQRIPTSNETTEFVIVTAACAAIFLVIIIIVAALIIKKRRNSNAPRALKSSGYENPKHAVTESSNDFPVYAEIQLPNETNSATNTTYASVEMVAKTDEGLPGNSIVYAELDLTSRA